MVPLFPGRKIDCAVIGTMKAEQIEENGKIIYCTRYIGISLISETFTGISDISQLPTNYLRQLKYFFDQYNGQVSGKGKVIKKRSTLNAMCLLAF